ncbi:MAG TPA: plasmid partition protein ParG [Ignavibacteriales bacterium]|nr:plasmid partition protein ParG [Ignavibacteriales bacterium]
MAIQTNHKNVPIPEDLHLKFKAATAQEGKSIKEVLIQLIEDYLKKHSKGK